MATKKEKLLFEFVDVQRQSGGSDCGMFALVFATVLAMGKIQLITFLISPSFVPTS